MPPCPTNSRNFFEKLQTLEGLALRDKRGQRHDLAVVLTGVTRALWCHRDGCLSSIHRHLVKHYAKLTAALGVERKKAVSRSHLPVLLAQVSVSAFAGALREDFGVNLPAGERQWLAVDGKELRGSLERGATRGEAVVPVVAHASQASIAQDYYTGTKESEVPVVRSLLAASGVAGQKISLEALHCKPDTLKPLVWAGGKYLVGLKGSQKELQRQMEQAAAQPACLFQRAEVEKGHGRLETREYEFYDVLAVTKAGRRGGCQLRTLISVKRERILRKSGKSSLAESYYVTNEVGNYEELCQAVRQHRSVETNNHLRDVSLREDGLRSKKSQYSARWGISAVWPCGSCSKSGVRTRKHSWKTLAMTLTV